MKFEKEDYKLKNIIGDDPDDKEIINRKTQYIPLIICEFDGKCYVYAQYCRNEFDASVIRTFLQSVKNARVQMNLYSRTLVSISNFQHFNFVGLDTLNTIIKHSTNYNLINRLILKNTKPTKIDEILLIANIKRRDAEKKICEELMISFTKESISQINLMPITNEHSMRLRQNRENCTHPPITDSKSKTEIDAERKAMRAAKEAARTKYNKYILNLPIDICDIEELPETDYDYLSSRFIPLIVCKFEDQILVHAKFCKDIVLSKEHSRIIRKWMKEKIIEYNKTDYLFNELFENQDKNNQNFKFISFNELSEIKNNSKKNITIYPEFYFVIKNAPEQELMAYIKNEIVL